MNDKLIAPECQGVLTPIEKCGRVSRMWITAEEFEKQGRLDACAEGKRQQGQLGVPEHGAVRTGRREQAERRIEGVRQLEIYLLADFAKSSPSRVSMYAQRLPMSGQATRRCALSGCAPSAQLDATRSGSNTRSECTFAHWYIASAGDLS